MKPRDFKEVEQKYIKSTERWDSIQIGDDVFVWSPQGLDFDIFRHEVISKDDEERTLTCIDHSRSEKPTVTLTEFYFDTLEETNEQLESLGMGKLK